MGSPFLCKIYCFKRIFKNFIVSCTAISNVWVNIMDAMLYRMYINLMFFIYTERADSILCLKKKPFSPLGEKSFYSYCCVRDAPTGESRSRYDALALSQIILTVPVGPLRFLAIITSASLVMVEGSASFFMLE